MKRKRTAFIPLDDRPCNLSLPKKIASLAGLEIVVPPEKLLGSFTLPGDPKGLSDWLMNCCGRQDFFILSCEMLLYGGLIASRTAGSSLKKVKGRLDIFRKIKALDPSVRVLAFSLVMRLSQTVGANMSEDMWKALFRYSELVDLVRTKGRKGDALELSALKRRIPKRIISSYVASRARNHSINKLLVRLVRSGHIDHLIIGSDDVAGFGLHRREKAELGALIKRLGLTGKVTLMCGADEIGAVLVSRAALDGSFSPRVCQAYSRPPGGFTPMYEDSPVARSVREHVLAAGGRMARGKNDADLMLFLNLPRGRQRDLFFMDGKVGPSDNNRTIDEIRSQMGRDLPFALVDIAYANGADPSLIGSLSERIDLERLASFSAWNTASNSIGSCVAIAFVYLLRLQSGMGGWEAEHRALLAERFIDDYLYQSKLRPRIKDGLVSSGVSPFFLGEHKPPVDWVVKRELGDMAESFLKAHFKGLKSPIVEATLPWPRIFEVNLDLRYKV